MSSTPLIAIGDRTRESVINHPLIFVSDSPWSSSVVDRDRPMSKRKGKPLLKALRLEFPSIATDAEGTVLTKRQKLLKKVASDIEQQLQLIALELYSRQTSSSSEAALQPYLKGNSKPSGIIGKLME